MVDPAVHLLREAALHRGYRLLVSKKRTPGVGDHGKFGLADGKGEPILGVGHNGLTASAADIETFLRGGELETWQKSAKLAFNERKSPSHRDRSPQDDVEGPQSASVAKAAKVTPPPRRGTRKAEPRSPRAKPLQRKPGAAPKLRTLRPEPAPLCIRKAKPSDSDAVAKLLVDAGRGRRPPPAEWAARLAAFSKAGSGLLVAEQGAIIGCLAWAQSHALDRPPSGRIATLVVAEQQRRRGIGRALVEEAARQIAKAGIATIEVMSDIEIRSAHGFFRKLGFAETSYRFARTVAKKT
jgi:ribosomal protein S18 acetylase RimI-like enzyme